MGLSTYLQSRALLPAFSKMHPDDLYDTIIDKCREWYDAHPEERALIRRNLKRFGIHTSDTQLNEIEHQIYLHYFEKFLPHIKTPQEYADFLHTHVRCRNAVSLLNRTLAEKRGILLVTAHFGGIEFLIPSLSMHKFPLHTAVRFTTRKFSDQMHAHALKSEKSGCFGHVNIIEIGKPGTMVALDMYAALKKKEILFSVFDEKTPYSIPVTLLGKKVWGGAGLNRLLRITQKESLAIVTAYMIRERVDSYRLECFAIDPDAGNPIQLMYASLERIVKKHLVQWYFLHEEIPFVNDHTA